MQCEIPSRLRLKYFFLIFFPRTRGDVDSLEVIECVSLDFELASTFNFLQVHESRGAAIGVRLESCKKESAS